MTVETRAVNAMIARGLVEPSFLVALDQDRGRVLDDMGISSGTRQDFIGLDCHRLALMATFICKVKNNDLWSTLPLTRALLQEYGSELEVFGVFSRRSPQRGGSLHERVSALVECLLSYASARRGQVPGLEDVVRHEWLVARFSNGWGLEASSLDTVDDDPPEARPANLWRPRIRGTVLVQSYEHDPLRVQLAWQAREWTRSMAPPTEPTFLCYSLGDTPGSRLRVFRMDPAVALIVGWVDGQRSPIEIANLMGAGTDAALVVRVLLAAAQEGIIRSPSAEVLAALQRHHGDVGGLPAKSSKEHEPLFGGSRQRGPDQVLDLVSGYAAGRLLYTLQRIGALGRFGTPSRAASVAVELGVDRAWLEAVVQFLAVTGGVFRQLDGGRYVVELDERERQRLNFELTKFVGAYGACLDAVGPAPDVVDADAFADAFSASVHSRADRPYHGSLIPGLLREFGVASGLLDLGCGTGDLLIDLAVSDEGFHGIGIDENRAMCARAVAEAGRAAVLRRVRIFSGDAFDVLANLPLDAMCPMTAAHSASFFNALFANGHRRAVDILTLLSDRLGRRLLFIDDYYGQLGVDFDAHVGLTWSMMQDLVQVCSGQGVPPRERVDWEAVYQRAGCRLLRSYEGTLGGFPRFIHVVQLAAAS